jgi:hypothetical protein
VGRRNDRSPARVVGRRTFDSGNRPASGRHEKCRGRQGASSRFALPAVAYPPRRRRWRRTAKDGTETGCRSDTAATFQYGSDARALIRRDHAVAYPDDGAQARASRPGGPAGAASLRPGCHLLLADRRARHAKLPLLRHLIRAREAVLLGSRQARLCKGARSSRGRRVGGTLLPSGAGPDPRLSGLRATDALSRHGRAWRDHARRLLRV